MPLLINRQPAADRWTLIQPQEGETLEALATGVDALLVPIEQLDAAAALNPAALGVQINGDHSVAQLQPWLDRVTLIAVEFPVFRDGRGYSLARQIRRLGYEGELRAVGNVGRDQLGYMERCGFNAFSLADDRYSPDTLKAFSEISVRYQGAADDPRPVYRQHSESTV